MSLWTWIFIIFRHLCAAINSVFGSHQCIQWFMTMLVRLPRHILLAYIFIFGVPNENKIFTISGSSCQQMYMKPARIGHRCMIDAEVYRNHTDVPQERCTWHCLRDLSCKVIDYNLVGSYCLLGHGPCASLQPDSDFVTTPMTMKQSCMTWVRQDTIPPTTDNINIYSFPLFNPNIHPDQVVIIARAIVGSERIPGRYQPVNNGGFYSFNGQFLWFQAGNYELLILSPQCSVTWVSYDSGSGNSLPVGSVIGGYYNGNLLYVARMFRNDDNVYVTGYYSARDRRVQGAHSPYGAVTSTVMVLLVVNE